VRLTEAVAEFRRAQTLAESHLHVFDMDGTLALSPEPTPENKAKVGAGKKWWGNPESLSDKLDVHPVPETKAHYDKAKASGHKVVVMTGRENTPEMRRAVSRNLERVGVHGHEHGKDLFLNPGRDTEEWKKEQLWNLVQHHKPDHVHVYDDRTHHAKAFGHMLKSLGVPHTIYTVNHPKWGAGDKMPSDS
jgi:hypothetical protein